MAQTYREMDNGDYFKARDHCHPIGPRSYQKTWTEYLENLADDEYAARRQDYSAFDPGCKDDGGSHTCCAASLLDGDDSSSRRGRLLVKDRCHHEEGLTDQYGDCNIHQCSRQRRAQPSEYTAIVSDPGDPYNGEYRPWSEQRLPLDEAQGDNSRPGASDQGIRSTTTGCPKSTDFPLPPGVHSDIPTDPSTARHEPRSRSQPDDGQKPLSYGRYNAGVRALQSPTINEQIHPLGGRYNMGVRVPQSHDRPSPKEDASAHIGSKKSSSVTSRFGEEALGLGVRIRNG